MLNLHVIQARYGDCLLLEYGTAAAPRYLLVDGGPAQVYKRHLKTLLEGAGDRRGELDVLVLSHVDDDHVHGLLDLLNDLQWQRVRERPETISIREVWHNSFSQTLGNDIQSRLHRVLDRAGSARAAMSRSDKTSRDIAQGDELTRSADNLGLHPNERFGGERIITVEGTAQPIHLGNLSLRILGPTQPSLEELRDDWMEWLAEQEERVLVPDPLRAERAARRADTSVPNLSSITFLAQADGKTILFTGDGRADHLLQGLALTGALDSNGNLHVDVLKLPHHGSKYNISEGFVRAVTADRYLISASGRHGHPHKDTLRWIVETARARGRNIEIVATNTTRSLRELMDAYQPPEYCYELTLMPQQQHAMVIQLAA
jgi:beta-lactamase superfamily II metal-dependent hydrolase